MADIVGEASGGFGAEIFGEQVEFESDGVGGLRVGGEARVGRDVFFEKGGANFLREFRVVRGVAALAEDLGDAGEQGSGVGEVSGLNVVHRRGGAWVGSAVGSEGEPVAETEATGPD